LGVILSENITDEEILAVIGLDKINIAALATVFKISLTNKKVK
jgi:hypothetical protein